MSENNSPNTTKIDLNPLSLALLLPNPTVIIEKEHGPVFIRLQAINSIETLPNTREHLLSLSLMGSERPILLSPIQAKTFMEKITFIANQVQQQIDAQRSKLSVPTGTIIK